MPKTLTVNGGAVNVGTAPNPPVRSVTAELTATDGIRAAAAKAISLGRTKVTVATGQRRAIKVKLNRAGERALRAHHSLRVAVRLTAVDTAGRTVKTTVKRHPQGTAALRRGWQRARTPDHPTLHPI